MKSRKLVLLIGGLCCFFSDMATEATVIRVDKKGRISDYEIPKNWEGLAPLCNELTRYVEHMKAGNQLLNEITVGDEVLNVEKVSKEVKLKNRECYVNAESRKSRMPGFAIYVPDQGDTRVYIADKESKGKNDTKNNDPYNSFNKYSHTERQLIITAIRDAAGGNSASNCNKNKGLKCVKGRLYVYTYAKPCSVEEGNDSDGISCRTFYAKIAEMYNESKDKGQSNLEIHILFSDRGGTGESKNGGTVKDRITEALKRTNDATGQEYQVKGTNIFVRRI